MKLPAKGDYYRPTRARDLREQADWLEMSGSLATTAGICAFLMVLFGGGWTSLPEGLLVLFGLGSFGLMLAGPIRLGQAGARRAEADRLEAEHAARHGSPRPGEVP